MNWPSRYGEENVMITDIREPEKPIKNFRVLDALVDLLLGLF